MAAQDILDSMFPVACAGVQNINRNNDLTEQEVNILYSVVDDFDNQKEKYDWKSAVQTISGVASRFVAKSNSKNNQIAMPLLIQQTIFFMAVRGEDYKLYKQTELMYEFTGRAEYNPKGKYICNNNTTLNMGKIFSKLPYDYKYYRSCRDYKFEYNSLSRVAYSQPVILFSYNGQKDKELGIAVKNLVYQAGKYTKFVDVFGGTGSASLAFPKRGYGEGKRGYVPYKYNDLDADLCNLYTVIKSEDYKVLIEELYKLKSALEGGEQLEGIDFNNEMIKFFNRATSASQKTRDTQQSKSGETAILDFSGAETRVDFADVVKYINDICENVNFMQGNFEYSGVVYTKAELLEKLGSLKSDYDKFMAYIAESKFYEKLGSEVNFHDLKATRELDDENKDSYVENVRDAEKRNYQARFYQYYAYFSNMLNSGVGTPVRKALAIIFVKTLATMGAVGVSQINKMTATRGSKNAAKWRHFLYPTEKSSDKCPEQKDIIEELHEQFQRIDIISDDFRVVIDSVTQEVIAEKEDLKGKNSKVNPEALFYVDSPYIATVNYKVGMFKPQDMLELIEKLYTTSEVGNKFIFSCRACGTKGSEASKADMKSIDKAIVETVYTHFNDIFLANSKPLWVVTISRDSSKDFFTDLVAKHEEAEIMITNYKVQGFEPSPLYPKAKYEVYSFKDFIYKLGQYLK